jgi:anti-sigma regulatory factor (Ser/Thr protein kinase)
MRRIPDVAGPDIERLSGATTATGGAKVHRNPLAEDPEAITLSFVLKNDVALIPAVVTQLMEAAGRFQLFDEGTTNRVAMAVHEAILNAIHHGNLELDSTLRLGDEQCYQRLAATRRGKPPYRGRLVHVRGRFDVDAAVFVVRDEGRGFDPTSLPDPTEVPCLERPSGRGLLLIRCFMDEVTFNPTGNEITLIKRRTAAPSQRG